MRRGSEPERLIERGFPDLQPDGRLPHCETLGDHAACALQLIGVDDRLATALATSRGGRCQASASTFLDQIALELPERPKEVEHQPAAGRGGVDCFGEGPEADAPLLQSKASSFSSRAAGISSRANPDAPPSWSINGESALCW